jgi:DNA polymerase-3 subunit gamma/tau
MVKLLESCSFRPVISRFKVYVIDEAHMLTYHAFGSMLKVLEEPPEHVKFVLCSTDVTKIPPTILSRSVILFFNQINSTDISQLLTFISKKESVHFEQGVLDILVRFAKGSVRDSLNTLEAVIMLAGGKTITQTIASKALGTLTDEDMVKILRSLYNRSLIDVIDSVEYMKALGVKPLNVLYQILNSLENLLIQRFTFTKPGCNFKETPFDWTTEEMKNFYQLLLLGFKDLRYSPDDFSVLTLLLSRVTLNY